MHTLPLVSVAISTYNRAALLCDAARSVLNQTWKEFELILCDDASTDDTRAVCQDLAQRDPRVRVLRHESNVGMVENWNAGLAASRGRYFAKLDDDNRYLPAFLAETVGALEATPEAAFAFTDEWFIDQDGHRNDAVTAAKARRYGRDCLAPGLHQDTRLVAVRQSPGINSAVFRREAVVQIGGFRSFTDTIGDADLFLNLADHGGYLGYFVPKRLAEYRTHEEMFTRILELSEERAAASVAIWEAFRFEGAAERLRRKKLGVAYTSLSRIRLLNGDVTAARAAIRAAWRSSPGRPRTLAAMAMLSLPTAAIQAAVRQRYRREIGMPQTEGR